MKPSLEVRIGGLTLRNPVLVASGIIGYGREYERLTDLSRIGGIVTKTVTLRPRAGNPPRQHPCHDGEKSPGHKVQQLDDDHLRRSGCGNGNCA